MASQSSTSQAQPRLAVPPQGVAGSRQYLANSKGVSLGAWVAITIHATLWGCAPSSSKGQPSASTATPAPMAQPSSAAAVQPKAPSSAAAAPSPKGKAEPTREKLLNSFSQLVLVISNDWTSPSAQLWRYARPKPHAPWRAVSTPHPVSLGRAGMGWGRGLHGNTAPPGLSGPVKAEGDKRAPAGAFRPIKLYGYAASPPAGSRLDYQSTSRAWRCVDDPKSSHYGQIINTSQIHASFRSAEHMRRTDLLYEVVVHLDHNISPALAGSGSCIFAHVWRGPGHPTVGCTAMARSRLIDLAHWLGPDSVWVSLPRPEYQALASAWGLPATAPR